MHTHRLCLRVFWGVFCYQDKHVHTDIPIPQLWLRWAGNADRWRQRAYKVLENNTNDLLTYGCTFEALYFLSVLIKESFSQHNTDSVSP